MSEEKKKEIVSNRRARYDYEILEALEAGIVLTGTEIKSLRDGGGSLTESYVTIDNGELFLIAAQIAPYKYGNIYNHEEKRPRKLLVHKRERVKLRRSIQEKGLTIVPLSMYFKGGIVKVEIAIARGKKLHDRRAAVKERESKREMDRTIKNRRG